MFTRWICSVWIHSVWIHSVWIRSVWIGTVSRQTAFIRYSYNKTGHSQGHLVSKTSCYRKEISNKVNLFVVRILFLVLAVSSNCSICIPELNLAVSAFWLDLLGLGRDQIKKFKRWNMFQKRTPFCSILIFFWGGGKTKKSGHSETQNNMIFFFNYFFGGSVLPVLGLRKFPPEIWIWGLVNFSKYCSTFQWEKTSCA